METNNSYLLNIWSQGFSFRTSIRVRVSVSRLGLFCGLPSVFYIEHFGCYPKKSILIVIHVAE